MVMEKSWNMKNWQKVMEFCDQSWNIFNVAPDFTKFVFLADIEKISLSSESAFSDLFCNRCRMQNLSREMVMEN